MRSRTGVLPQRVPSVVFEGVDTLLQELKGGEEHRVDRARAAHGHAEAAIHVLPEELDLYRLDFLPLRVHETIPLIDAFGRVDGI